MTPVISPDDQHNRQLVQKLHPAGWQNPAPVKRYNLVVVGAGPAGLVAAAGAAGLGAKVALVERHLMGGDCLNYGCVPSKALLMAAHKAHNSAQKPDFAAVMASLRQKRNDLAGHDSVERFTGLGVDVFLGEGKFISPSSIDVGGQKLNFHRAVIATGARAALPPIPGLADISPLTNETLFSLVDLPESLTVIGAGPVGCEMAQAFCRLGAKVTLIEMADRILPNEDPDASRLLSEQLAGDGVEIISGAEILRAEKSDSRKILVITADGVSREIKGDEILVAAGRIPNLEGLNLAAAGVDFHKHGVTVNDRLQTTNPKIFGAGDICSPHQFTHSADAMAKIVIQNALFFGRKKVSSLVMPRVIYCLPEVAHAGMTAARATAQGDKVLTLTIQMSEVDRAILAEETGGFARVHLDRRSGRILGATMVAPHAGEIISEMTLAITAKLKMSHIGATLHPYPTRAEVWKKLASLYLKESFTPKIAGIFKLFLNLFSRK